MKSVDAILNIKSALDEMLRHNKAKIANPCPKIFNHE